MDVLVVSNYEELSRRAAELVDEAIHKRPNLVLGLPTGSTPLGLYAHLVRRFQAGATSWAKVRTFNLDEYYPVRPQDPWSFRRYMEERLFRHVDLRPEHIHFLDGQAPDPEAECRRYEEAIASVGGLDLVILGLGVNGHIGFNEPGTPWDSRTHLATLSQETVTANFGAAPREADDFYPPRQALTMGIATVMEARQILLLVSGANKSRALGRAFNGPVTPSIPASILQRHPHLTVIADRAAVGIKAAGRALRA